MMGSSPPSQSTLSDLKVLLELLQAASDPKKAKAAIDSIAEARKQYDDAIAESSERLRNALAAENKAEVAASKAEAAAEKLEKKQAALEARQAELSVLEAQAVAQRENIDAQRREVEAEAVKVNDAAALNASENLKQLKAIAADRTTLEGQIAAFDTKVQEVKDLKAEYEAKLAKIKALTE